MRNTLIPFGRPFLLALAAVAALGTAGCNTFRGAGQDIEKAGEEIEETAEELDDGDPKTP